MLSWALLACRAEDKEPPAHDVRKPLNAEIGGCTQIPSAGVCELAPGSRELALFVPAPEAEIRIDGKIATPLDTQRVQNGTRLRLRVPADAKQLSVASGSAGARVRLGASQVPARVGELRDLRKRGALAELATALDTWEAELGKSPADAVGCDHARLLGMRARLAFSRGESQKVDAFYERAVPALLACGRLSEAVDDAMAQAYNRYEHLRDFSGARASLARVEALARPYPWGAASIAYHQAFLAMRLGQLGQALAYLDVSERGAERLAAHDLRSISLQLRSWVLSILNRHEHAGEVMDAARVLNASAAPCERAALLTNLGWQRLLAQEAGHKTESARLPLSESVALLDAACTDRAYRSHALINLSRLDILEGSLDEAERHLKRAAAEAPDEAGAVAVALLDLRGRVLLKARDPRGALAVYEELSARARAAGGSLPMGALGRAKALLALSRKGDALAALEESEDELELQLATVSLGAGRESLSLGRGESAHLLVRTLVETGQLERAFVAARRARARLLWSLQRVTAFTGDLPPAQRHARERAITSYHQLRKSMDATAKDAWTLPKDELARADEAQREQRQRMQALLVDLFPALRARPASREVGDGELLLGIFPLGAELFVFLQDVRGVRVLRRDAEEPVDGLVAAVAPDLRRARAVSVVGPTQGSFARLHGATLDAGPLGLQRPISYALDVPRSAVTSHGSRALFVFDPRGDLKGARQEADWLKQRRAANTTTWLLGGDATRERVLAAFAGADLLHYAGHAAYDETTWWESGLTLADRSSLTISDILAAPQVPRHVVLAACATARARAAGHVATLGIAHAFIAAGADDVIATLDRVEDSLAFAFTRAYHAGEGTDAGLRLARASRELDAAGHDWTAFVRLVP